MTLSVNFFAEYAKIRETSKHCFIPDKATYNEIVTYLSTGETNEGTARKKSELNNWKTRFSIHDIDGSYVLYNAEKKVVFYEQIFEILHQVHVEQTGHGGRDAMRKNLKGIHGLGAHVVDIYLKLCKHCELKKARVRKSIVVKPILERNFNKRAQADLIDCSNTPMPMVNGDRKRRHISDFATEFGNDNIQIQKDSSASDSDTTNSLFSQFVRSTIDSLPLKKQAIARFNIQQVLFNLEAED